MKPKSVRCMKLILSLLNIIFILFGLFLMALCVINLRDSRAWPEKQSQLARSLLAFILTLALTLVGTAVLGCIGALRENVKILYMHSCLLSFLVFVDVVIAIAGIVVSSWGGGVSEFKVAFFRNSTANVEGPNLPMYWDKLQSENQCCGVDGPQDYADLLREIPASCCARAHFLREGDTRRHFHSECLSEQTYYVQGCEVILRRNKAFMAHMFISNGLIFLVLELASIIFAIKMARSVKKERRRLTQSLQAHFEA